VPPHGTTEPGPVSTSESPTPHCFATVLRSVQDFRPVRTSASVKLQDLAVAEDVGFDGPPVVACRRRPARLPTYRYQSDNFGFFAPAHSGHVDAAADNVVLVDAKRQFEALASIRDRVPVILAGH
jgi:hypothetical protein